MYQSFVHKLIRNYIIGSLVAVFGVGGMFIFSTIEITAREAMLFATIMGGSLVIMLNWEYRVFRRHQEPIRRVFEEGHDAKQDIRAAYLQLHKLPVLSVQRTFGPHLTGFAIPALLVSIVLIAMGVIDYPYRYVLFATIGALMVAGMHALLEFFLTSEAITPMLNHVRMLAKTQRVDLGLDGRVFISIRKKAISSALLIGIFPALLLSVATDIRLTNVDPTLISYYWQWASVVLVIVVLFSSLSAWLLTRAILQPIEEMLNMMAEVKQGNFEVEITDNRSDEFARLFAGFNLMVRGLKRREDMNNQLLESYFTTLAAALDARDPYTAGHSLRVAQYSEQIAILSGMSSEQVVLLRKSALLHDIGKIGVRDSVLLKDGKLTDEEFEQIKMHPVMGEEILKQIQPAAPIAPLLPGVRSHHERYDGRGYPDGLAGTDIPLFGRIIAVADAYDAMTSDRPYRQGMPVSKALSILEDGKGTQWDPVFSTLFVEWMKEQEQRKDGAEPLQFVQ